MKKSIIKHLKNVLLMTLILILSVIVSTLLQDVLIIREHITTVFVFLLFS